MLATFLEVGYNLPLDTKADVFFHRVDFSNQTSRGGHIIFIDIYIYLFINLYYQKIMQQLRFYMPIPN